MANSLTCYVSDETLALLDEKRETMGLSKNQFLKFCLLVAVDDSFINWIDNAEETTEEEDLDRLQAALRGR